MKMYDICPSGCTNSIITYHKLAGKYAQTVVKLIINLVKNSFVFQCAAEKLIEGLKDLGISEKYGTGFVLRLWVSKLNWNSASRRL